MSTTVSIIISTYNGAHKINGILDILKYKTDEFFELIVVIDGSTDNSLEVISSYKEYFPVLHIIYQENQGRAVVKNTGACKASGELLLFFDDDMLPTQNCINEHIYHHEKFKNTLLTGGLSEFTLENSSDIQHYRVWLRNKWNTELRKRKFLKYDKFNLGLSSANFSISKKLFYTIGMFDSKLTDSEDLDLAQRAFEMGYEIYCSYDAFAWHNDFVSFAKYISRNKEYYLSRKDQYISKFTFYQLLKIKLFNPKFWVKLIDNQTLIFLPKKIRFYMYDSVLWVHIRI